jgi:membrane-anchored protein YejM (alkaline phosphatase superfamily)
MKNNSNLSTNRRQLCRWAGWFFVANVLLFFLTGLNYLFYMPDFNNIPLMTTQGVIIGWVFMLTGLMGQYAIFAFAGCIPALVLILLFPRRWFAFIAGIIIAATTALFLIVDSIVYHLYHYHLAGVVWHIIRAGVVMQVLELSWIEWLLMALLGIVLLAIEMGLAFAAWHWINRKAKYQGRLTGVTFAASLFLSYTLTLSTGAAVTADASAQSNDHVLVMEAQIIPYYDFVLGQFIPGQNSAIHLETRDDGYFVQNAQINKPLHYPLHPLQCKMPTKPYNIVMITLDAWRFDMLNPVVTPHINDFAKNAWSFAENVSGGNSTQPGIFSLLYSIPENYWTAMIAQHQGPVFIHQLLQDHYQMGIFRSASLHYPAFDETAFREVKNLQINTPGAESFDRDRQITREFTHFIDHRNTQQPFFSFVFYDETHNYCESSAKYSQPFQPAIKVCNRLLLKNDSDPTPYLNRYRNAGHFDDALVNQVLTSLKSHHLLSNTIVIITADHGEEFNESHQDFWGHASDYTPWQTHTPLVIYWPGQAPKTFRHLTSHYDLVPTLMTRALGCNNPTSDYSIGDSLLAPAKTQPIIVNSYIDYGIVEKNRVTRIYPDGNYAIVSPAGTPLLNAKLNTQTLAQVFGILNKYFK